MDKVYDMNSGDTIQIGDSDEQKNTLFVLDQFTMTETKEGWEKEPTGIFAFVLGFLRFLGFLGRIFYNSLANLSLASLNRIFENHAK